MAQFIEQSLEDLEESEEFVAIEEPEERIEEAQDEPIPDETPNDIPDKYQGKAIQDIVQMHQEAEKLLGRQSSEVGELRKIVDDFVKSQIQATSPPKNEAEEIDFFTDPDKAMARAIENHPKLQEAEKVSMAMKQQQIMSQLHADHPDFINIIQDQNFLKWKDGSRIRQELYDRADKKFDYDSAHELLTSWKERQNIVQETAGLHAADRKRQLKAASTGNTTGSTEAPSRKIYRRADIIKLIQTDPKRYNQLSDEIMLAYEEGRVK
tara:strand:+ start:1538 stop:2335 length:798 start_codon:yes stop_codon:yes gene_type:complete